MIFLTLVSEKKIISFFSLINCSSKEIAGKMCPPVPPGFPGESVCEAWFGWICGLVGLMF